MRASRRARRRSSAPRFRRSGRRRLTTLHPHAPDASPSPTRVRPRRGVSARGRCRGRGELEKRAGADAEGRGGGRPPPRGQRGRGAGRGERDEGREACRGRGCRSRIPRRGHRLRNPRREPPPLGERSGRGAPPRLAVPAARPPSTASPPPPPVLRLRLARPAPGAPGHSESPLARRNLGVRAADLGRARRLRPLAGPAPRAKQGRAPPASAQGPYRVRRRGARGRGGARTRATPRSSVARRRGLSTSAPGSTFLVAEGLAQRSHAAGGGRPRGPGGLAFTAQAGRAAAARWG